MPNEIELVNVPEPNRHKVEIAKVKQIVSRELQVGEIILFGFNLLLVQATTTVISEDMFRLKSLNLSTGESISIGYPINSIFHRVIEAEITELDTSGGFKKFYTWLRMRKPVVGEMTICGVCQGDTGEITQEDVERFGVELENKDTRCGALWGCYEPTQDVFLGYDNCEEPDPRL